MAAEPIEASVEFAAASEVAEVLLRLCGVTRMFGGLAAVSDLDLEVPRGAIFGLIGPNGAGKTTVFSVVTGANPPTSGSVVGDGRDLTGRAPVDINRAGIARTFQNIRLFSTISVSENVKTAASWRARYGWFHGLVQGAHFHGRERALDLEVRDLLERFDLWAQRDEQAGSLPYGDQRRLEMVRALATRPRLLLLDEPAAGLNDAETTELMGIVRRVRDDYGLTILLIEHDMRLVMELCDRIAVLDHGVKISEGAPCEVRRDPAVIAAYLGEDGAESAPGAVTSDAPCA